MSDSPFDAAFLRYHPRLHSGEQINVGLIVLYPEERQFAYRLMENYARVTATFPGVNGPRYRKFVRHIRSQVARLGSPSALASEARELSDSRPLAELLQEVRGLYPAFSWSEILSGVGQDASETCRDLYEREIGRFETPARAQGVTDKAVLWSRVERRPAVRSVLVQQSLRAVTVAAGSTTHEFPIGWRNGALQVADAVPLDYVTPARMETSALTLVGRLEDIAAAAGSDDVRDIQFTAVVTDPPGGESHLRHYNAALESLSRNRHVRYILKESDADQLAAIIRDDLAHHSAE